jgi:uroporphyrinogen-III synthase
VVTRPRGQAAAIAGLIEAAGGEALRYPSIEIAPPRDTAALLRVIDDLARFDMAIFISPTAVQEAMKHVRSRIRWPANLRPVAVGPGTRRELELQGFSAVLSPASGADSEALLAVPELGELADRRIVIFRGDGGRQLLGESLSSRGAHVTYAQCYRREKPGIDFTPLAEEWERSGVDAVTVFSAAALANLFSMLPAPWRTRLVSTPLFVSHRRIGEEAKRLGARTVRSAGPGDEEMLAALVAYFRDAK